MRKIQDKQIEGIIFKGGFCPFWGGSSIILATAVIEYEDGIQNVPIPQGSK